MRHGLSKVLLKTNPKYYYEQRVIYFYTGCFLQKFCSKAARPTQTCVEKKNKTECEMSEKKATRGMKWPD